MKQMSFPHMEDCLYDVESMCRFGGVDINGYRMRRTGKFRYVLEADGLTEALYEQAKR